MRNFNFHVDSSALNVTAEAVARYFGGSRYRMDPESCRRITAGIDQALELSAPIAVFGLHAVDKVTAPGQICLENGVTLDIPHCATDIHSGAMVLAAVVATLGSELEKTCRVLGSRGNIYRATLLDAAGTCMLESLDAVCRQRLQVEARRMGLHAGPRFAPGLNDCDLTRQATLFRLVDTDRIGVSLNTSCIMEPVKSISMFTLLTPEAAAGDTFNKCTDCRLTRCQFRKISPADTEQSNRKSETASE